MRINPTSLWHRVKVPLIVLFLATTVIIAYYPGLRGPFVFDDSVHIVDNPSVRISTLDLAGLSRAGFSDDAEILQRPLAKMSFALNYYFSGEKLDPYSFKVTNLIIHLLNASLVYWFIALLLRQLQTRSKITVGGTDRWIPMLATALWTLHPIQLTSVLYVVQRMNSLSAFFVLAGLIAFVYGRQTLPRNSAYGLSIMSTGLLVGLALGVMAKENAALLPLFIVLTEITFFRRYDLDKKTREKLYSFYLITALVCLVALFRLATSGTIEDSYLGREFTMVERLLTESRILWHYIGLVFLPDLRNFGLFHDDIPLSRGLLTPWTTLPALTSILLITLAAILLIKKLPIFGFSVLWFLIGHSMESGVIGLEIAHEHRNYLPSLGLILGIAYGLHSGLNRHRMRAMTSILGVALVIILAIVTNLRSQTWSTEEGLITQMAHRHPLSARSQYMLGNFKEERLGDPVSALLHYQKAAELAPQETGYYIKMATTAATAKLQAAPSDQIPGIRTSGPNSARMALSNLVSLVKSQSGIKIELDSTIANNITNSLKHNPPSAFTIGTLRTLTRCIDEATEDCQRLYPAQTNWYRSLLDYPHLNERVRNDFTVYSFNLGMNRGDHRLALESARISRAYKPENYTYSLMEANALIVLNQLDKAEEILTTINGASRSLDEEAISNRNQLLSILNARRNAQNSGTKP